MTVGPWPGAAQQFVGPYRLTGVLGRGRYAVVHRARHRVSLADVALKVWREPVTRQAVEQFRWECRVHASMSTAPRVTRLLACSMDTDTPLWSAMQLCDRSLGHALRDGAVPRPQQAVRLVLDIVEALDVMHARGFVHRDVTPENILLVDQGAVLSDFGIAAVANSSGHDPMAGTPDYRPPEASGGMQPTPAADLFALGLVADRLGLGGLGRPAARLLAGLAEPTPSARPTTTQVRETLLEVLADRQP